MRFSALLCGFLLLACRGARSTDSVTAAPDARPVESAPPQAQPAAVDASIASAAPPPPASSAPAPPNTTDTNATQTRCGWLDNPTPANWWLVDRDATWIIGVQGGYQADGIDRIPDFGSKWKVTNAGSHGYGCACLRVKVDAPHKQVLTIEAVSVLPLQRCQHDAHLDQSNR
jgi:hypothetical protein